MTPRWFLITLHVSQDAADSAAVIATERVRAFTPEEAVYQAFVQFEGRNALRDDRPLWFFKAVKIEALSVPTSGPVFSSIVRGAVS
jgi:hypothetical protein